MATDFTTITADGQKFLNDTSAVTLALLKKFANRAYRDAWTRHPWTERHKQAFLPMLAPYSTGTVAVTNNSTTVTLTGGTWPTDVASAGYKFALSVNGEWYGVATRSSGTVILLDRVYLGTTDADTTYIVYCDVYALATDVGSLLMNQFAVHKIGYGGSLPFSRARAENEWGFPTGTGTPCAFILHDRPSTAYRIRVGPQVPSDASFAVRYSYLKDITELSADADEPLFVEEKRDIIFWGMMGRGYMLHGRSGDARDATATFERLIAQAWQAQRAAHPVTTTIRAVGASGSNYPVISFPVVAP